MKGKTLTVLSLGVMLIVNSCSRPDVRRDKATETATPAPAAEKAITPSPEGGGEGANPAVVSVTPTSVPVNVPLQVGAAAGKDVEHVLLLYYSGKVTAFDYNFCNIADYYGVPCVRIDLFSTKLTDDVLHDSRGDYYKLVGISARTLLKSPSLLSAEELAALKDAIRSGGLNLVVSNVNGQLDPANLLDLTDGAVQGAAKVVDSKRDWLVSSAAPDITSFFSGQSVATSELLPQDDGELLLNPASDVTTLISSTDDAGKTYPIFVYLSDGAGSLYIDSAASGRRITQDDKLVWAYYGGFRFFSSTVPMMLAIRHVMGDAAWHSGHNFANLTIDDATLTQAYGVLSYPDLLKQMEAHNFFTTIAAIPAKWQLTDPNVAYIFFTHPDRYSIVQHGNNHDGYEFYKYVLAPGDSKYDPFHRARPLSEQNANILQGLQRMTNMSHAFALPFGKVMIFPYGISPAPTLTLLKKYNYLGTVNAEDLPLGTDYPRAWDFEMYPAEMDFEDFPVLTRRHPGTYLPFKPNIQPFVFDLFIGKPALFYSHANGTELFAGGIQEFNTVADQMNGLVGDLEWRSLDYILTHLYLEKTNLDGSMDVKMYTNHLKITNNTNKGIDYHVSKKETLNVPISSFSINGQEFLYSVKDDLLRFDVLLPAHATMDVSIQYSSN